MNDSTTARLEAAKTWGYFEDVGNAHSFSREIDPEIWELGDRADFATLVAVTTFEEAELLVARFNK